MGNLYPMSYQAGISQNKKKQKRSLRNLKIGFVTLLNAIPFGIHMYTLNENDELVFSGFNPAAEKVLNIDHASLIGKTLEQAFPPLAGTELAEKYRKVAKTGATWFGDQVNYEDKRIVGIYSVTAFQTGHEQMAALFEDVTSKQKAAEQLRLSEEKFSTAFLTSPDSMNIHRLSDGMYLDVNEGFVKLTGYSREEAVGKTTAELNMWANPGERELFVEKIQQDKFVDNMDAGFRMKNGEIRRGLLSARVISINDEICLLSITRDLTDRINAENNLREAHKQLEEAYEATLQGWVETLDLREHETAKHSRKVVELTLKIAQKMNFDEESLVHIGRGALLHDIGKMGVPDEILLKPEPLLPAEWMIMKQHPRFARELLAKINFLNQAIDIPYCHHEKWDGTGYPRGLKGTEIPLSARIFSVADVWDALLSDRPYRSAWENERVKKYMLDKSGSHFDPDVIKVLFQVLDDEYNFSDEDG